MKFEISKGCRKEVGYCVHGMARQVNCGGICQDCYKLYLCPVCEKNNELVNQVKEARDSLSDRITNAIVKSENISYSMALRDVQRLLKSCFEVKE